MFGVIPKMTCTRETVVTIRIVTTQGGVLTLSLLRPSDEDDDMTGQGLVLLDNV